MSTTISMRCVRTDAGKAEIRSRSLALSRSARTLLLIIDNSRLAVEWLSLVQGASQTDLESLLTNGLIASTEGEGSAASAASSSKGAAAKPEKADKADKADKVDELDQTLDSLTYGELYTLLTDQAKARFGLIKGYRLVLEVEKCTDLTGLQALGHRFVGQIRDEQGEAGLKELRKALGV
jgi:hypothetical protein